MSSDLPFRTKAQGTSRHLQPEVAGVVQAVTTVRAKEGLGKHRWLMRVKGRTLEPGSLVSNPRFTVLLSDPEKFPNSSALVSPSVKDGR